MTVHPDLTFDIHATIDRDYNDGKIYYELARKSIEVPKAREQRPDQAALNRHATQIFRP